VCYLLEKGFLYTLNYSKFATRPNASSVATRTPALDRAIEHRDLQAGWQALYAGRRQRKGRRRASRATSTLITDAGVVDTLPMRCSNYDCAAIITSDLW